MSELSVRVAGCFSPLLKASRYKGAHGGRGSGKSQFFADEVVKAHLANPGRRTVCIREVQKSLKQSAKRLIEDKIEQYDLASQGFRSTNEFIETPGGGTVIFQGMQDHTAESVKSLEGFDCAWVEEAQTLSELSLQLLRPTIRKPGSELWFSWNPRRADDPVDKLLRGPNPPTDATVVKANWNDNPWFPHVLENERKDDQKNNPDQYGHIWEGDYIRVIKGAYYASALEQAQRESRITVVPVDPIQRQYAYWDIGGTSNTADATAIWVVQFVGELVKIINYYEAVGQEFGDHIGWLHKNDHSDAVMMLPHDGRKHDIVHRSTPRGALEAAGFKVEVLDNIGTGAAMKRVEAGRRVFPRVMFNAETTKTGRDALGWYHAKIDSQRNANLGPEHDWSSHAADAFGGMCVDVLERPKNKAWKAPPRRNMQGIA
jgi:phage terminase large subunit